ncbi:MAG: PKD domain-containing protein [Bacteroidota bacterium]|nr:PKD domain-containing protein [Bacteroidota bacterium]
MFRINNIKVLLYLAALILPLAAHSQVYVAGTVNDKKTGEGIKGQEVYLMINDSVSISPPLVTDKYGQFKDTLGGFYEVNTIFAYVLDCKNEAKQAVGTNPSPVVLLNFEICVDNPVPIECEALYYIEPDSNDVYRFKFHNKSVEPEPGDVYEYLWDFGDGNFSTEENPDHVYQEDGVYTVCLSIQDTMGNCNDEFCAPLQVPYQGECNASYTYSQQGPDPLHYQFIDLSYGNYYTWEWDFGDGYTSDDPNPSHTYAAAGAYYVCLRIYDQTLNCDDTFCDTVYVNDVVECIADFDYQADSLDPQTIHFADNSTGEISEWEWDFGDGNYSYEQNPVHYYNSNGTYEVCLTVSGQACYDQFCTTIIIQDANICVADFYARVDSTSSIKNMYYFTEQSTGNINEWYWDFGDGTYSYEQHPSHEYQESGTYEVCLTVSGYGECSDTHCETLQTLNYFDLGGLVFAGAYPLNNPVPTGDTGIAYLYKKYPDNIHMAVDTFRFYTGGYYWFVNIIEGDYLLKIGLTEHSGKFDQYFPTYFSDELNWIETTGLSLWDSNYYSANVHLTPTTDLPVGNGHISGNVHWCSNMGVAFLRGDSLQHIMVILADESGNPLRFKYTNQSGGFSFGNIPTENYQLYADITGVYSSIEYISLAEINNFEGAEIELCKTEIIGLEENFADFASQLRIYPNPASGVLHVEIIEALASDFYFEIHNMFGMKVQRHILKAGNARQSHHFNVNTLRPGIYIYKLCNSKGQSLTSGKIVKR